MSIRIGRSGLGWLGTALLVLGVASCIDDAPVAPETDDPGIQEDEQTFAVTCRGDVSALRFDCGRQDRSAPQEGDGLSAVIFGGQDLYVTLASSNVNYDGGTNTFSADVTITNLIPQPMATPDNSVATEVRIFFHTGPTNGVTVANADGTATFTAAGQPYHSYIPPTHFGGGVNITLEPNETSAAKTWEFDTSGISGTEFQFSVLVSADVPFPDGWVELDQEPAAIEDGNTETFTATVYDVVGREVSGRTLTWESLDTGVFTVNSASGLATAVGDNSQSGQVVVTSDGPEAPDTASVRIYELLEARTPIVSPYTSGGDRLYKFTVPGGSGIVAGSGDGGDVRIASNVQASGWGTRRDGGEEPLLQSRLSSVQPVVQSVLGLGIDSIPTTSQSSSSDLGADVYVRYGAPPVIGGAWDCRPFFFGSRESCTFDDPASGDWFVLVDSPSGGEDFTEVEVNADLLTTTAGYEIDVVFVDNGLNADQQMAVTRAVEKWATLVTGDLRPMARMGGRCGGQRINRAIDDLYVPVATDSIDGPSGTLAFAGWCYTRGSGMENPNLPFIGGTTIDANDLAGTLADTAQLRLVVVHELGHAMGIGSLWSTFGLISGAGTSDPTFTGPLAIAAYETVGGPAATEVPVANTGGSGTADAHWRESVFDTELMTGYLDSGENPLSLVSAQSLADEGYTVDTNAVDAYTLPGAGWILGDQEDQIPFGNDIAPYPGYAVDSDGTLRRIK